MELEEGEVVVEEAKQPKESKQAKEKPIKSKDKKDKEKSKKKSKKQKEFTSSTYKTKQCEFYKKGGCQKGETCTFSHDFPLEINNTLCRFFLGGACTKENCVFSHEKSKFPCKYYHVLDTCESGTFCQFSHQSMDEETLKAFVQENETFIKDSYQKYGYVKLKIPNLINQPVPNQPKSLASYYYPEQSEIPQPKNNFDNRNVPPLIQRMGAQITTNFNRIASNPNPFSATNPNFQSMSGLNPPGSPQTSLQINQIPHPNMNSNFTRPRPNVVNLPMSYPNSNNYMPNPVPFNSMPPPGLNPQHPQMLPQYPPMNSQLPGQFNYNTNANAMNQNSYYQPNMAKIPINLLNTNEINFRNANMNNNFQNNINIGSNIINNQNMNQTIKTDMFSSEKTIDKNVKNHNEIIKNVETKAAKPIQAETKLVKDVEKNLNITNKNKKPDNSQTKKKTNDFIKFEKNNYEKKNGNIKRKANSSLNYDQQNTKKIKTNEYNQKKETNNFLKNQKSKDQINLRTDFQKEKVKNKGNNALQLNEKKNKEEKKENENKDQMLFSNENEDINKILKNIIYKRKIKPILIEESKINEETEYKIGEKKPDVLKRLDQILKL